MDLKESSWKLVPQWLTLSAVIGGFIFLHGDINGLSNRIDQCNNRVDRLYEMFVDLLKDGRK